MYYLMFLVPLMLHPLKLTNRIKGLINSLALGAMAAFRFGAGADYFSYSYLYYLIPDDSILSAISKLKDQEIGMKLLMFPFRYFNLPYEMFVVFIAIIMITLMFLWIDKNSKSVSLSYLVYYSFFFMVWNLSSLRQGLALTIGCFLLFNEEFNWKFTQKLMIIFALYFLHKTALFYLVFIVAESIKWDRRKLIFVVLGALVVSILPIGQLAEWVAKIPIFARVSYYLEGASSIGFWDFKSLPRLFLIAVVLFHYDDLRVNRLIPMRFVDAYILGISFFFVLRFDDLIGARISIYGFFLAILILPAILGLYSRKKQIDFLVNLGFVTMCALYLQKELLAMAQQAGIAYKNYYVPYISVLQRSGVTFSNGYYYANNYNEFLDENSCVVEIRAFSDALVLETSSIRDTSKYIAAKFPDGLYGLIDTEGNVVLSGRFSSAEYYGGIIRVSATQYYNVKGVQMNTQKAAMIFFTAKAQTTKYILTNHTWFEIGRDSLDSELIKALELEGQFKFLNIINQVKPLNYYMMEYLSYKNGRVYRLYNTDMTLLSPEYFLSTKVILNNRVVKARNVCGTKYFNESGELIWMQLN